MVRTQREIALRASREHSRNARRRRFARYAEEMADHPQDITIDTQHSIAEALSAIGWTVRLP